VLLFFGVQKLLEPRTEENVGWGVGLLSLGAVHLLINFQVLGLSWTSGWPLFLISVGLGFIAGAIAGRKEASHAASAFVDVEWGTERKADERE
jgi:hypothetical protein